MTKSSKLPSSSPGFSNMPERKKHATVSQRPSLSVVSGLSALAALLISLRYPESDPALPGICGFIMAALGHFLIFYLLTIFLIKTAVRLCRIPPKTETAGIAVFIGLSFVFILADTFVYQQYHFHINLAMMDLFFNSRGEVISFGTGDTIAIVIMSLLCFTVAALIAICGTGAGSIAVRTCRKGLVLIILMFIVFNGINIYENASARKYYTVYNSAIPGFYPLTMNRLLNRMGINAVREKSYHAESGTSSLRYPLNPLNCPGPETREDGTMTPRPDIFVIMIDTLRADTVSPEITPGIWNFARENIRFNNHFSGGNNTRIGVFSFFYGIPGSYWNEALQQQTPPALLTAYLNAGYRIQAYTSANLYNPEFYRTVFAKIPDLRTESKGRTSYERDANAVNDFMNDISRDARNHNRAPSFSFIFLDQLHSITLENKNLRDHPFPTSWIEPNYTSLSRSTNPENFFNLYKNVAREVDTRVSEILDFLKNNRLYDDAIIIITSDHGNEFNDTGLNFWGHNSNFTEYQLKVPLIIKWPGKQPRVISNLTTHYDISATLLQEELKCSNAVSDYSVGNSLFSGNSPEWFIAGSYSENAIVSRDQIALINSIGKLSFKTPEWKNLPDSHARNNDHIIQAINIMTRYFRHR